MRRVLFTAGLAGLLAAPITAASPDVAAALTAIKAVGKEGQGNAEAKVAWKKLVAEGGAALLPTLEAFKGANPTAANWLRSAVDGILDADAKAKKPLPAETLIKFLTDTQNAPDARRIAFELIEKSDAKTAATLLPNFLNDRSLDLRRDAIAAEMEKLKDAKDQAKDGFSKLLVAARDIDQVEALAKKLEDAGGPKTDLVAHLGFITNWQVVGPFDAPGGGFETAFPPDKGVDLTAEYDGKEGKKITWKPATTAGFGEAIVAGMGKTNYGMLDLNKEFGKVKSAVVYAYAEVDVAKDTPVDLRAGSQNSLHISLNGKKLFERDEFHHGTSIDQHIGQGTLKAGKNTILLKVCQNDQKEPWAQQWLFQLRLCDDLGGPIAFKTVTPMGGKK